MEQNPCLLIRGKIYSSEDADSIVVEDGKIKYIGQYEQAKQIAGEKHTPIFFPESHLILPGFIDSHMHPIIAGMQLFGCMVDECKNENEIIEKIKSHIESNHDLEWIFCSGYRNDQFHKNNPHRNYLDQIITDKPISIISFDCHSYLLNSNALLKIDESDLKSEIEGGIVEKDELGEYSGVFHEKANALVRKTFPAPSKSFLKKAFQAAVNIMYKNGITSFNDACVKQYQLNIYKEIYSENYEKLPRCNLSIAWSPELEEKLRESSKLIEILDIKENSRFQAKTVKIFVDGVVESQTALLKEPYYSAHSESCHNNHGTQNYEETELNGIVKCLIQKEIQCHFHTVGDKGVNIALNAIESNKYFSKINLRHTLAHNQLIYDEDVKRFQDLGVIANFSPFWCYPDKNSELTEKVLGKERALNQYPIKSVLKQGGKICFGSDWPVSTLSPLDGIEVSITRKEPGVVKGKSLGENQSLTSEQAIEAYTKGSAYSLYLEDKVGSLEVGYFADLIVLDKNILKCEPSDIHKAKVVFTMIEGQIVYEAKD